MLNETLRQPVSSVRPPLPCGECTFRRAAVSLDYVQNANTLKYCVSWEVVKGFDALPWTSWPSTAASSLQSMCIFFVVAHCFCKLIANVQLLSVCVHALATRRTHADQVGPLIVTGPVMMMMTGRCKKID